MYELKRLNKTICLQTGELARLTTAAAKFLTSHFWGMGCDRSREEHEERGCQINPHCFLFYLYILALFELFYDINKIHSYTIYVIFKIKENVVEHPFDVT